MELQYNNYQLACSNGGIEVRKGGKLLYFNRRPLFVTVKTMFAVSELDVYKRQPSIPVRRTAAGVYIFQLPDSIIYAALAAYCLLI